MITTEGKTHIKRYLAGQVPSIAQSIAFGIGATAESAGLTKLTFEVDRSDIELTSFDFVNNKLIFKGPIPDEFEGKIYEVAIFSTSSDEVAGEFGSMLLTTFDSATEGWADPSSGVAPTYNSTNTRIGSDSMRHTPALSTTEEDALAELLIDLSGYSGTDKFVFAFNVGNAFTSNVKFRFLTDVSNYYEIALGAQSSGYKTTEAAKSTATVTGAPDWAGITEIRVLTTSTAGGASSVDYDGIRIDDADTVNPDYVMVARELLSSPFTKEVGKVQEAEYALDISI